MSSDQDYKEIPDNEKKAEVIEEKNNKQETSAEEYKNKCLWLIFVVVATFLGEYLTRGPYTRFSDYLQENINFDSKCWWGDVFVWFKYKGKNFIFLFLFNISNIFVSLTFIILDSFGIFINGTIKLIYCDPRPYWRNHKLIPCTCATNYGSPSTTGLDVYLFCIVVYRGLINRSNNKWWKFGVWTGYLLPQILAWTSRFIQNIHSLPQLTFGWLIGYIIQYFYFEIMEIDMFSTVKLKKLINCKWLILTILLILVNWFFFNAIHYFFVHPHEDSAMVKHIGKYCSVDIPYFLFDNESYQKTAHAFVLLGALFAVLLEYRIYFNGDFDAWATYNMSETDRWSATDNYKTTLRMLVMYFLGAIIIRLPKWGSIKRDGIFELNLSKCIVHGFWKGFFYFIIIKTCFKVLTISNETYGCCQDEKAEISLAQDSKKNQNVELITKLNEN
jgi:hypothetical protein